MSIKKQISKKVIAVVYVFENEDAEGYKHFYNWSGVDISMWLTSIEFLGCIPYIIDTRSFIDQAVNRTLPHIDFVLNLNNGNINLDSMSLIPSLCEFLNIPCIPSSSTATLIGENKNLSNLLAKSIGLNIPSTPETQKDAIFRPNNLGNSNGVVYGDISNCGEGIKQKFIKGYDITTPVLYNPIRKELEVLPSILYHNYENNVDWFLSSEVKVTRSGYNKTAITLDNHIEKLILDFSKLIGIGCYCRIDSRVECKDSNDFQKLINLPIPLEKFYFIEINSLPTIKQNTGFLNSLNYCKGRPIQKMIDCFENEFGVFNDMAFLLYCSIQKYL